MPFVSSVRKRICLVLAFLFVSVLVTGWWSANATRKGQAAYYILGHHLETWWASAFGQDLSRRGHIAGAVRDDQGRPLEGATVIISTRWGQTASARSDEQGRYLLSDVPVGRAVPAAVLHGYAAQVYDPPWPEMSKAVRVRPGKTTSGIDFVMRPVALPELPSSLNFGEPVVVSHDYPQPTMAQRTRIQFDRLGYTVTLYVYEPDPVVLQTASEPGALSLAGSSPALSYPGLFAAYPGDPLEWEPASMAFVAQGYVVLAIGPVSMRGMDITADVQDTIVAMILFHQGALSPWVDPGRVVALGGSFSSLALLRALHDAPTIRGVVLMGGLTDVYRLRYDVYVNGYTGHTVYPHLERAMWSLGRPDRAPRLYIENAPVFSVRGLPPLCIIHGTGDMVIPYDQSERLAAALQAEGQPYELHIYRDTGHYPGIYDPDPDTEAMYRQMVLFFAKYLDGLTTTKEGEPLVRP